MEFVPEIFMWHLTTTAILMLCVISGIISYYSKEKSFQYYAIYSFFLLTFLLSKAPYEIPLQDAIYDGKASGLTWYVQVIYNCVYFIFFISFLDVKTYQFKIYRFIKRGVGIAFGISTAIFVGALLLNAVEVFAAFFKLIFTPLMFLFGLYTAGWALTVPGKLKLFIVTGSVIFASLAVTALVVSIKNNIDDNFYFYIGIFIEQIAFAVGLAYKVRKINQAFLFQLTENEKIRSNQNKILEEELQKKERELLAITKKAEEDRVSKIQSDFENEIHQLHLSSLQSQMNPHFIFNALNSIKAFLIENNKEQAIFYLNKFAKLIRKILDSSRLGSVSLQEELETIQIYIGIENIRFDNKVNFHIAVDDGILLDKIKVPPLILQPFVENALWHGLMLSKKEKSLEILVALTESIPVLTIKDNGIGRKRSQEHKKKKVYAKKSLGLKMTNERIDHFNFKEKLNYSFEIIDLVNGEQTPCGTEVRFSFFP